MTLTKPRHIQQAEAKERERLLSVERHRRNAEELRAVSDGVTETVALERGRGEQFVMPRQGRGERTKPIRRVAGLDWLADKGKIDRRELMAGEKYGARLQAAYPSVGSCLDVRDRVGMPQATTPYTLQEVESFALFHLRKDQREALQNVACLIDVLNEVCGYGKTPRDLGSNQRECERKEDQLLVGLRLLAAHYGL